MIRGAAAGALVTGTLVLAAAAPAAGPSRHVDGTELRQAAVQAPASPLNVLDARFGQVDQYLTLSLRTGRTWRTSELAATGGRSLCLRLLTGPGAGPGVAVCAVPARGGAAAASAPIDRRGGVGPLRPLPEAIVRRANARTLSLKVAPGALGLAPGLLRWQVRSTWTGTGCQASASGACLDQVPAAGPTLARLVAVQPIGCDSGVGRQYFNGSRRTRMVGLSFDDGPSIYTPHYLDVLEAHGVRATFFQIGEQVAGTGALEARILRDGDEIGDHTYTHPDVAGGGSFAHDQISRTRSVITSTSGYTPCLFRPPGGATSPALVGVARSLGLATIIWDVDPTDWARPGTDAIYRRVTGQVRPGSIILMHDGGGDRSETLAALPRILDYLHLHGYQPVPISVLLGFPTRYGRG